MSAPLFSIIVPVFKVRAYLRLCMDSILEQSFADFEVIAVDDASPDGCGDILDEYAAKDARVRVVHLAKNGGLGPARNVAMPLATGTYIMFVDSDDTLAVGALEMVAQRLEATENPEILLFDYSRTYWSGGEVRNTLSEVIHERGPAVFRVDERPELLHLLMVVWNKVYRRDWLVKHGFEFPTGYYEDLPWTYPTMITAERIAVLDRVCYFYRQRRHGNILRSQSKKHFEVYDQYTRVFDYLDAHPDLERWRVFLFQRAVAHMIMILRAGDRVHRSLYRDWFTAFADWYAQYEPAGCTPPKGWTGTKIRAVARRNYLYFIWLHRLGTVVRVLNEKVAARRKSLSTRVTNTKRRLIHGYYWLQRRRPIDENLAVYAAYWARGFSCNPAAIYTEAKRIAPQIRGVWVVKKENVAAMPKGVDYVKQGSFEYFRVMARAKYLFNNVNFPDEIVKRPGTVHIQTHHGTPLKRMGLDLREYPAGAAGMSFRKLLERCDRWDVIVSSNSFSSEVWERVYPCDYVTLETGYPRNDRLVRATPDEVHDLRAKLKLPAGKTIVLYAPTFRDWTRRDNSSPLDLARLCADLGDDFVVLARGHYFTSNDQRLALWQRRGILRDVTEYPVIEDLMIASDLLITDYSSTMFDYAVLDKPIVVYAEDYETYAQVRGVNFDLLDWRPGHVAMSTDELADVLTSRRYDDAESARVRAAFRARFCSLEDGRASERVVRTVLLGEDFASAVRATSSSDGVGPLSADAADNDDAGDPAHVAEPVVLAGDDDVEEEAWPPAAGDENEIENAAAQPE